MIIQNQFWLARIDFKGAQLTSLFDKINDREWLHQGDPHIWNKQAPILFPICGQLKNNQYQYNHQSYHLTKHGFLRDMDFVVVAYEPEFVTLSCKADDETKKVYPFDFEVRVTYQVTQQGLQVNFEVINHGTNTMFYSLGAHPGFTLDLDTNYQVSLNGERAIQQLFLKAGWLHESRTLSVPSFSVNRASMALNDTLLYQHVKEVSFKNQVHQISIIIQNMDYLAVWSPLGADGQLSDCVCIEPWAGMVDSYWTNGLIDEKIGIVQLSSQQRQNHRFEVKIGV